MTKTKIPFKARTNKDMFSYKLAKYVLANEKNFIITRTPYLAEVRCDIKGLKLDKVYRGKLYGHLSVTKEINSLRTLPVNPKDVKQNTILWVLKDREMPFLKVGYPLSFLEKNIIFYNPKDRHLIKAIELMESKCKFNPGSIDGRRKPWSKDTTGKEVEYYTLEREGNSVFT